MKKTNFTVSDLIEQLQKFPQELPVLVTGYESGYENFYHPKIVSVTHHPDNMYYDGEYQIAVGNGSHVIDAVILERVNRDD